MHQARNTVVEAQFLPLVGRQPQALQNQCSNLLVWVEDLLDLTHLVIDLEALRRLVRPTTMDGVRTLQK